MINPIPHRPRPVSGLLLALSCLVLLLLILLITHRGLSRSTAEALPRPLSALLHAGADLISLTVDLPVISTGHLTGYLGGVESVVISRATAQLGSDLTRAMFTDIDLRSMTARLEVPLPQVRSVAVEAAHHQTQRYGLWTVLPFGCREGDAAARALRSARVEAYIAASAPHLVDQATRHATAVLTDLAATAGWTLTVHTSEAASIDTAGGPRPAVEAPR